MPRISFKFQVSGILQNPLKVPNIDYKVQKIPHTFRACTKKLSKIKEDWKRNNIVLAYYGQKVLTKKIFLSKDLVKFVSKFL